MRIHRYAQTTLLHREQIIGRLHERDRIDRFAFDPHFIVEVAAGRTAGRTHAADQLAARDALAGRDQHRREMAVTGFDAAPMVELDEVAIAAIVVARGADDAVGGGIDRRARRAG